MVKKIISIILAVAIFGGYSVFAQSVGSLSENFCDGVISDDYRTSGSVTLTEDAEKLNYLTIGSNSYFQKLYTSPVTGGVYITFDINFTGSEESYMFLKSSTEDGRKIIEFKNNSVYCDGNELAVSLNNGWNTFSAEVSSDKVNVYFGDELIGSTSGMTNVQIIRFGNVSGEMLFDNFSVLDGGKPEPEICSDEEVDEYYAQGFNDASSSASGIQFLENTECLSYKNGKGVNGKALCFITEATGQAQKPFMQVNAGVPSGKAVLSFHIKWDKFGSGALLPTMKGSGSQGMSFASLDGAGNLSYVSNGWQKTAVKQLSTKKWYRIQIAMDMDKKQFSMYVDYTPVAENIPFGFDNMDTITAFRFQLADADGIGASMYMDNITLYSGENLNVAPRLEKELNSIEATQDITAAAVLEPTVEAADNGKIGKYYADMLATTMTTYNAVGMAVGAKRAWKKNGRFELDVAPEVVNDRTHIPLRSVSEAFDMTVDWDDAAKTATIKNDQYIVIFKNGDAGYSVNGTQKQMDTVPYIKDDSMMIPLRFLAEAIGKKVTYQYPQLITIGDAENFITRDNNKYIFNELLSSIIYERPSSEQILSDIEANGGIRHPGILGISDKYSFAVNQYKQGIEPYKTWGDKIIDKADTYLDKALVNPDDYADANVFLTASRNASEPMLNCSMAYLLTGNEKYAQRAWKEMDNVCGFTTWYPDHFLNVGEMTAGVAISYDMLYSYLTEEQKDKAKAAVAELGLAQAKKNYDDPSEYCSDWSHTGFWVVLNTNWNLVCNGGIITGALMLADDPAYSELAGEILESAVRSEEYGLMNMLPEGGWDEGMTYWSFAMRYFVMGMSALETATGKDYGFKDTPSLDMTGYYPFRLFGAFKDYNFHDSEWMSRMSAASNAIFFLADWYNDEKLNSIKYDNMRRYDYSDVQSMIYFNPDLYKPGESISLDGYVKEVESGSFRQAWNNEEAAALMFHGADVIAGHGHIDVGSFVFDADGERWAIDLGPENYTVPGYFDDNQRYTYYRTRAEGHNVVVINPDRSGGQSPGGKGVVTEFVTKPKGGYAVMDLSSAYDSAKEYKRGYLFTGNRNVAIVQDEITMTKPSELYWFMHINVNAELSADKKSVILSSGEKQVEVKLLSDEGEFEIMNAKPLDTSPNPVEQSQDREFKKLAIHLQNVEKTTISVAMYSITNGNKYNLSCTPIDSWSIADGELIVPTLDSIKISGHELEDFVPSMSSYTVMQSYDSNCIPKIEASSDKYNVEIINTRTVPGKGRVILTDKTDSSIQNTYTIEFKKQTIAGVLDTPRIAIAEVTASDEPQPENPKEASIDGNLETRWSADGVQWITYDLGGEKTVNAISIAFMKSESRKSKFKLLASSDGENWTEIFQTQSSGNISGYETFGVPQTTARYIRIEGSGNTENSWNSINEVIIYGH